MADLLVYKHDEINISSFAGNYSVHFIEDPFQYLQEYKYNNLFYIIDENIFNIYSNEFKFLERKNINYLVISAIEESKSLEKFPYYIDQLIKLNVKRGTKIIAIGGGIIQDISGFLSSIFLRGLEWIFLPTTLLAQADSCIGSKTSINNNGIKNIVGNFYPPKEILISGLFLNSLKELDIHSGIGEIIKIHAINGQEEFKNIEKDFEYLFLSKDLLLKYIKKSLKMKKKFIEEDEFDRNSRLVLNYGHSFGHAIESATNYEIPHGIAVSLGCHFANFISMKLSLNNGSVFNNMADILRKNYSKLDNVIFDENKFFESLSKDKKNTNTSYIFILPDVNGFPVKTSVENNIVFKNACIEFLSREVNFIH